MTAPCFVDANVFVYALDSTEPFKNELALALLTRLWSEQRACTSVQAINEFYAVATRKLSHVVPREAALAQMEDLLEWNPLPIDSALLRQARSIESRYKLNWWDCLIVAAARAQNCAILYTEDLQHGGIYDGVKVINPFIAQVQEEAAPWRQPLVSPHRPRGRPRKQAASA